MSPQIDEETSEKLKIDLKDNKILEILRKNSRITYQQISKQVHLSHDAVRYRIQKLEKSGIIDNYSIKINYPLLGYNEYQILFQHIESKHEKIKSFYNYLIKHNNIINVIFYSDKWDLKVVILAKDAVELDKILTDIDNKFSDILIDQQILGKIRDCVEGDINLELKKQKQKIKLDDTDKKILNILSENSRTSLVDISKKVNLDADTIMYRIKKLQNKNIIDHFGTNINANKLGMHWYNVLLLMKVFTEDEEKKLRDYFNQDPNLIGIIKTIGEWNLILTILAESPKQFHEIATKIKLLLGDSLKDYDSLLAYKELKNKDIIL